MAVSVLGRWALSARLAIGLPVLGTAIAFAPLPATAQTFAFTDIVVQGTERVDPGTVLQQAQIPRGQPVTAGELNAAFQRISNSGLFESVDLIPQGNRLVIQVMEFPTINRINIEGNRQLDDEDLLPLVGSVPRRVYSPAQAEDDARNIAMAYEQSGRLAATVTPRIIRRSQNRVDLVFEVAEGRPTEIERLSFVGNRAYSDRRLRRVLGTTQAGLLRQFIQRDTFVADRIAFDRQALTDFYRSRGFIDFRVLDVNSELARDRDGFFVTFNIQEGQPYRFGNITASSQVPGIDAADYLAVSRIRQGQTYSPQAIEQTIARMERLATQRGLNFIRATPNITRDNRNLLLNVDFQLERGPRVFVERIDIEGNATTLDRVIRRQFDTVEGDPFNPREIRAAAERIRALGYFSNAEVEARDGTGPSSVIIDVDVEEQPTGSLGFGGSFSTDSGVGLNVSYTERNFLGRGQTLQFQVNTGTEQQNSRLTFIEPAILGRDLAFRLDAFYRQSNFSQADYDTTEAGISPSIAFPISENARLTLRYRISEDTIEDVDTGEADDPEDNGSSPIIVAEEGSAISSSVGYTLSYDTRRTGLDPNSGVLLRFGQDFAGLGGDVEYIRTTAEATAQTLVANEEVTLRATIEGGAINAIGDEGTRITDRFFLSTSQVRGFEPLGIGPRDLEATNEDALGGNLFAAARFEAEFPLGLPQEYGLRGGVFLDAGSVWSLDETEGANGVEVDDGFILRSSVGVSLFWTSPLGPLRFNFAEALAAEDFDETRVFNVTLSTSF